MAAKSPLKASLPVLLLLLFAAAYSRFVVDRASDLVSNSRSSSDGRSGILHLGYRVFAAEFAAFQIVILQSRSWSRVLFCFSAADPIGVEQEQHYCGIGAHVRVDMSDGLRCTQSLLCPV
ncbi:hypothetical protein DM860_008835 [Cuscuta australis]|uniref:Uncharacterized protein n=1 Tax=Cuscuta australis TaxID=267555 RepID=A0A328DCN2_9ASTE|nr:hypothetical protein DM860_008835 [Cuscuta australis]